MKRILSLVLALLMVMGTFGAVGAAAEGRTLVRIAWLGMNDKDTMDPINGMVSKGSASFKELIEAKMPNVEIQFIGIPGDGWIQKMETTLTSGEADIGWYTNQVLAAEWFVDHREFMENDPDFPESKFEEMFTPGAKKYTRYHTYDFPDNAGDIYGLPYDVGAYWLMYDKVIFEQWGVEVPEGEMTYAQLLEMAQKMTGTNPVTGKPNFGAYVKPFWCEWLGVGADLYHVIEDETMDIAKLDVDKDVEYIKDSPEVLSYFQFLTDVIACSPAGAAAGTGNEKWLTPDNDIAIMLDTSANDAYMRHQLVDNKEITDRFIPIMPVYGAQGVSAFPEVHHIAVAKLATDKQLAWEVVKLICTDIEVLDFVYQNYPGCVVPALADPSGLKIMENEFVAKRYQDRLDHTLITDDYWYWREPINKVFSSLFSGELTPETAREAFYNNVVEWVANKKMQLGK